MAEILPSACQASTEQCLPSIHQTIFSPLRPMYQHAQIMLRDARLALCRHCSVETQSARQDFLAEHAEHARQCLLGLVVY